MLGKKLGRQDPFILFQLTTSLPCAKFLSVNSRCGTGAHHALVIEHTPDRLTVLPYCKNHLPAWAKELIEKGGKGQ